MIEKCKAIPIKCSFPSPDRRSFLNEWINNVFDSFLAPFSLVSKFNTFRIHLKGISPHDDVFEHLLESFGSDEK